MCKIILLTAGPKWRLDGLGLLGYSVVLPVNPAYAKRIMYFVGQEGDGLTIGQYAV